MPRHHRPRFFFFQAEDGIRDVAVTGVQTCALPICYGRGGDHYPFYKAGLPAVRFTEPLEDYHHQHQTPRTENGIEYGDFEKYLNFTFMGDVARDNAEALRQLALAPAPPANARLTEIGRASCRERV